MQVQPIVGGLVRVTGHGPRGTKYSGGSAIKVVLSFTIPRFIELPIVWILLSYRRLRYGYAFRRIPLTKGKYTIVDPQDYQELSKHKWHVKKDQSNCYARRIFRGKNGKNVTIAMHRQILNVPKGMWVDHINHNALDNRRANLRPATPAQNCQHRRKSHSKPTKSKYKGVTWDPRRKRWRVQITAKGSIRLQRYFRDEIEAAKAYDRGAKKYHGEFASLNFES